MSELSQMSYTQAAPDTQVAQAIDLLRQCAAVLMRSGGMLNKDLARDAVKAASVLEAEMKQGGSAT